MPGLRDTRLGTEATKQGWKVVVGAADVQLKEHQGETQDTGEKALSLPRAFTRSGPLGKGVGKTHGLTVRAAPQEDRTF